jgi:hypothetical protein
MADEIDVDVRKVWDALDDFAEAFKTTIKVEGTVKILWPAQFHYSLCDQSLRPLPIKGAHVVLPKQRRVNMVSVGMVVGEYRVGCGHSCFFLLQKYSFSSNSHHKLAKSRFFSFLCSLKQLKLNQYEQNFEGDSSPNADDGFCGGIRQAAGGTSKTSSRGVC